MAGTDQDDKAGGGRRSSPQPAQDKLAAQLHVLSAAARDFAEATHDLDRLLDMVAERLADIVKDQCVLRLLSEDGQALVPASVHGIDARATRLLREVHAAPARLEELPMARRVHETGEPFVVAEVDVDALRANTSSRVIEWARRTGVHSLAMIPLRARGVSFGQLLLTRYRPESPAYDDDDVAFARTLADHAAIAIANARSFASERAARAAAERAKADLEASEARYRLMFDHSPLPKWLYDVETLRFLDVNATAVREYGYSREEFLAMTIADVRPPEDVPALMEMVRERTRAPKFGTWKHRRKDGTVVTVEVTTHAFTFGGRDCRLAAARNVSDRAHLEEQLRQSQKMEAVGRLAGGVAHDFNNLLSVVLGCGELLRDSMAPDDPLRSDVDEICKAGVRAADLTRQLLMFSRQQVLAPRVLDLAELLRGMDRLLQRILGADIDLVIVPSSSPGRVRVDPSSIEQAILNLVINARDAMPTGGKLTLETGNVDLDDVYAGAHFGVRPGPHVMLAVTDTGAGMDAATQARIFEPFFTTKPQGKGTGLGLSTVFGIVQQSGGSVWVYSEIGHGTTFKVYLPRVGTPAEATTASSAVASSAGAETILLVEDEDQVRAVARTILRRRGYEVIEARNGNEALERAAQYDGRIHLLLTDVVMPQMSGPELARRLVAIRPDTRVLCMSGYTDDSITRHGVLEARLAFLQKPLTPDALAAKVRDVLDRPKDG